MGSSQGARFSGQRHGASRGWLLPAIVLLTLLATAVHFYYSAHKPGEPISRVGVTPIATPPAAETPVNEATATPPELPPLDQSDPWVRKLAAALSSHPKFAAWLANDRLIRRFAVAVDNLAEGIDPKVHLPFLAPGGEFAAIEQRDRSILSPESYRRYNAIAEVFSSLDARGAAEVYRTLKPLIEQAYRELGYPDRSFDDVFGRAVHVLLATPVVEGPIELAPRVKTYRFADASLEGLSPAQKQLLRMGPQNVGQIQAKLRELVEALGLAQG